MVTNVLAICLVCVTVLLALRFRRFVLRSQAKVWDWRQEVQLMLLDPRPEVRNAVVQEVVNYNDWIPVRQFLEGTSSTAILLRVCETIIDRAEEEYDDASLLAESLIQVLNESADSRERRRAAALLRGLPPKHLSSALDQLTTLISLSGDATVRLDLLWALRRGAWSEPHLLERAAAIFIDAISDNDDQVAQLAETLLATIPDEYLYEAELTICCHLYRHSPTRLDALTRVVESRPLHFRLAASAIEYRKSTGKVT